MHKRLRWKSHFNVQSIKEKWIRYQKSISKPNKSAGIKICIQNQKEQK